MKRLLPSELLNFFIILDFSSYPVLIAAGHYYRLTTIHSACNNVPVLRISGGNQNE